METITIELTDMANGGAALGRDENNRVIFVPFGIPGEKVLIEVAGSKKRFAWGEIIEIIDSSTERVEPRCPYFGVCGGCHYQHIRYETQLRYKEMVITDQIGRIGGIENIPIKPVLANPEPWAYAIEVRFSRTKEGELGFWSPKLASVMPIEGCPITRQELLDLLHDVDLDLDPLRNMTLRLGDDGAMLATLEIDDGDPPALTADFPISVALILPDGQAINLVGDNHLVQSVKGRDFRVSAGSFFYPSPPATDLLIDTVSSYASLNGASTVLELYSGVGTLTAFLAENALELTAIEENPDAVADTAVNLSSTDNVMLYEGPVEEILPHLTLKPEVIVVDPPQTGLTPEVIDKIAAMSPDRLIYVSSDMATLARDAQRLTKQGFRLIEIQPIDMYPQIYHVVVVALWSIVS